MENESPWAKTAKAEFKDVDEQSLFEADFAGYRSEIYCIKDAVWIRVTCTQGTRLLLRAAYAAGSELKIERVKKQEHEITLFLTAAVGTYRIQYFVLNGLGRPVIRLITTFNAVEPLLMPFSPRDLIVAAPEDISNSCGTVHVQQMGTRSGLLYVTLDEPQDGAFLYFQNLTSLNDYAQATETSLGDVVGGTWPEMGFSLPAAENKPLQAGTPFVLSDAFLAFDERHPANEFERAKQYLDLLAAIYLLLPKPDTAAHDWLTITEKGLQDLEFNHGCWSHAAGKDYLNAYVADYQTPPESMVQLAVLLPLTDYYDWCQTELPAIKKIKDGLDAFFDPELKTMVRFLPALADQLNGSEEQLKPNVMDAWYLHHPLLNLARLATRGDAQCRKLFMDSLDFVVNVAHHFNYEWPVMYDLKTLDVIKAETSPGNGGEKDVAGLYALVMLHAWELTKKDKYLTEAKKAAKSLKGKGFDLFYQANNTAFSANATLWLYKETKEPVYLDLAYLCLANLFRNVQLWDCNYGYAKEFATFFAIFPLNDAPYTAAYEEQEVAAAFHQFLLSAEDIELLPSVSLLMAEFLKYVVNRAAYYYPPNLPKEMLSEDVKTGQLDPDLWIAIEDLHDGWEKSGTVGQEVYGAGVAFGIVPRHFYRLPDEDFLICVEYPSVKFKYSKPSRVALFVQGTKDLTCRLSIIRNGAKSLPKFKIVAGKDEVRGSEDRAGNLVFNVAGDQQVKISW